MGFRVFVLLIAQLLREVERMRHSNLRLPYRLDDCRRSNQPF